MFDLRRREALTAAETVDASVLRHLVTPGDVFAVYIIQLFDVIIDH